MRLFDGGARDRAELLEALKRLGPTDVDRLSTTLQWPTQRTVRTLRGISGGVRFDPASGSVGPLAAEATGAPKAPAAPGTARAGPVSPAGDLPVPGACPECHGRLSATGTTGTFYCAACGHLETHESRAPAPVPARTEARGASGAIEPRVAQELIAAWVTSQPIPCPSCRTPLVHRGVQVYRCPACGEVIEFSDAGVSARPASAAPA